MTNLCNIKLRTSLTEIIPAVRDNLACLSYLGCRPIRGIDVKSRSRMVYLVHSFIERPTDLIRPKPIIDSGFPSQPSSTGVIPFLVHTVPYINDSMVGRLRLSLLSRTDSVSPSLFL